MDILRIERKCKTQNPSLNPSDKINSQWDPVSVPHRSRGGWPAGVVVPNESVQTPAVVSVMSKLSKSSLNWQISEKDQQDYLVQLIEHPILRIPNFNFPNLRCCKVFLTF